MKETDLPYPGVINTSQQLRIAAVKAISDLEVSANRTTGKHPEAAKVAAFFLAAAAYITDNLVPAEEPDPEA